MARLGRFAHACGLVDGVDRHSAVSRPFAAGNRDQSGFGDDDGVLARQFGSLRADPAAEQGPQAGVSAQDVGRPRTTIEVAADVLGQVRDLLLQAGEARSPGSLVGVSVVPTKTWSCQGIAKSTRPSSVRGTRRAVLPGMNDRSRTRWAPWLSVKSGAAPASSSCRTVIDEHPGRVDHGPGLGSSAQRRFPRRGRSLRRSGRRAW